MTAPLDPTTLRTLAEELSLQADHLARCCRGEHLQHRAQIALLGHIATDYRSRAIRAEGAQPRREVPRG